MSARHELSGAVALVKRDVVIFTSYRVRFVAELVSAVLGVTLFYYVSRLVSGGLFETSDDYFAYAVIGVAVLQVLTACLVTLPQALRQELLTGTFERLLVSAFGPVQSLLAMSIFPFATALASASITVLYAAAVFGMPVSWSTMPLALPAAVLGYLAFLPFAVAVTAAVFLMKQVGAGAGLLITCLSLVAGVFFPVALLPGWIQWASEVQPLTPAADLLRYLVVGSAIDSAWAAAVRLVLFAAVLVPASVLLLWTCLRYAQRRGTVLEY